MSKLRGGMFSGGSKKAERSPVFYVVDPELKDQRGHYLDHDSNVAQEAAKLGFRAIVLGNRQMDPMLAVGVEVFRTFKYSIWETRPRLSRRSKLLGQFDAAWRFFHDLRRGLRRGGIDENSIVYGQMVYGLQIMGWALFALTFLGRRGPQIVILLRFQSAFYDFGLAPLGFRILERVATRARVQFVTDSRRLAKDYTTLTSLPFGLVPFPIGSNAHRREGLIEVSDARPLRLVSLGNARDEKGFLEIVDAINILATIGGDREFEFILSAYSPWPTSVEEATKKLRNEQRLNVTLIETALSRENYDRLLYSADLVLLPYWAQVYGSRTSGPFGEALAAGKPVIVTEGTWMADFVHRFGNGEICRDKNSLDLARALLAARTNLFQLQERAAKAAVTWSDDNNPARTVQSLLRAEKIKANSSSRSALVVLSWDLDSLLESGAGIRIRHLIEFLSQSFEKVVVLQPGPSRNVGLFPGVSFLSFPKQSRLAVKVARAIEKLCVAIAKFSSPDPKRLWHDRQLLASFIRYRVDGKLFRWVGRFMTARDFAAVFVEYPFAAPVVQKAATKSGTPTILSNYDVLTAGISTPLFGRLVRTLEKSAQAGMTHVVSVSAEDQRMFREMGVATTVIPNSVDPNRLAYQLQIDPRRLLATLYGAAFEGSTIAMFIGSRHAPNEEAALQIKRVARAPGVEETGTVFVVAGSCAEPERLGSYVSLGRIDDLALAAMYAIADVVLVPLQWGTGMSLKTIEAMALGKVVIGTKVGFRGLPVENGVNCIIEDEIDRYPELVANLAADLPRKKAIGTAAMEFGAKYDFRRTYQRYLDLLGLEYSDARSTTQDFDVSARLQQTNQALSKARELAASGTFFSGSEDIVNQILRDYLSIPSKPSTASAD